MTPMSRMHAYRVLTQTLELGLVPAAKDATAGDCAIVSYFLDVPYEPEHGTDRGEIRLRERVTGCIAAEGPRRALAARVAPDATGRLRRVTRREPTAFARADSTRSRPPTAVARKRAQPSSIALGARRNERGAGRAA